MECVTRGGPPPLVPPSDATGDFTTASSARNTWSSELGHVLRVWVEMPTLGACERQS